MWDKVKKAIAGAAPLLGTALGGPAGGAVASLIAGALGVEETPDAIEAELAGNPEALLKLKQLQLEHAREIKRLVLEAETKRLAEETAQLAEINVTMRAEAAAADPWVRRWRPTYGYATAATWTLQMVGLTAIVGWAVIRHPGDAATIIDAVAGLASALMVLWAVALAVLGVNVSKRSQDKQVAAGQAPVGLLGGLLGRK